MLAMALATCVWRVSSDQGWMFNRMLLRIYWEKGLWVQNIDKSTERKLVPDAEYN